MGQEATPALLLGLTRLTSIGGPGRTRTCIRLFRRQLPDPLGYGTLKLLLVYYLASSSEVSFNPATGSYPDKPPTRSFLTVFPACQVFLSPEFNAGIEPASRRYQALY